MDHVSCIDLLGGSYQNDEEFAKITINEDLKLKTLAGGSKLSIYYIKTDEMADMNEKPGLVFNEFINTDNTL